MLSRLTKTLPALLALIAVRCLAGETLVDPTRPATTAAIATPVSHPGQLRVEAIVDRDGHRIAIVGGQVIHSGEHLAWGDIEEITLTGVRYTHDGKVRFAELENTRLQVRRVCPTREVKP
jgi:hypothetical protein